MNITGCVWLCNFHSCHDLWPVTQEVKRFVKKHKNILKCIFCIDRTEPTEFCLGERVFKIYDLWKLHTWPELVRGQRSESVQDRSLGLLDPDGFRRFRLLPDSRTLSAQLPCRLLHVSGDAARLLLPNTSHNATVPRAPSSRRKQWTLRF